MSEDDAPAPLGIAACASGATALVAVGVASLVPAVTALDAFGSKPESNLRPLFALGGFVLGGLAGATVALPTRAQRLAALAVVSVVAASSIFGSAISQTLGSITSGPAVMTTFFMFPIWLGAGLVVAAVVGLGFAVVALSASGAARLLGRVGEGAQAIAALLSWLAALGLVIVTLASSTLLDLPREAPSASNPADAPPPPPKPGPCEDPPFVTAQKQMSVRASSAYRHDRTVDIYLIGHPDWTREGVENEAHLTLLGKNPCGEGDSLWTAKALVATPVQVTLRVRLHRKKARPRDTQWAESNVTGYVQANARGTGDGFFAVALGDLSRVFTEGALAPPIRCDPGDPDLTCADDVIAFKRRGAFPVVGDLKLEMVE